MLDFLTILLWQRCLVNCASELISFTLAMCINLRNTQITRQNKRQKMLDICAKFAFDNEFIFNGKKSCCIAIGKSFDMVISRMLIGNEHMEWVNECTYLGVKLMSGKIFTTVVDNNKRKFYVAFNDLVCNGWFLSEEILMEIFVKQCVPILMYGACNWRMNAEEYRKVCVCFNRAIRRVFGYKDFESVRGILLGFSIFLQICLSNV